MVLKKLKIESFDPTGVVIDKYEMYYKVSDPESMRVTRLLLTIDKREYRLSNDGNVTEIWVNKETPDCYQGDWGWSQ